MNNSKNGFEKREELGSAYWKDKRWKKVTKLRKIGEDSKANNLVMQIRCDYGLS